jgi:hypothetical protein
MLGHVESTALPERITIRYVLAHIGRQQVMSGGRGTESLCSLIELGHRRQGWCIQFDDPCAFVGFGRLPADVDAPILQVYRATP